MLINIRGTHGAGKSAMLHLLIQSGDGKPVFGHMGVVRPEAYECHMDGVARPMYVLGPYLTPCGGCDAVQPYALVSKLIRSYQPKGHVLFEGALVSTTFGEVGQTLAEYADSLVAYLDTPLEICLQRVKARRKERGDERELNPANTVSKHKSIQRTWPKFEAAGVRVVSLNYEAPLTEVLRWLREAP